MIRESRLIGLRASDFYDVPVKYTTRVAGANAGLQDQVRQEQLQSNQLTGVIQNNPAAGLREQVTKTAPLVDEFGKPTAAGVMNQAQSNAGGTYAYKTKTGETSGAQAGAMGKPGADGMLPPTAQQRVDGAVKTALDNARKQGVDPTQLPKIEAETRESALRAEKAQLDMESAEKAKGEKEQKSSAAAAAAAAKAGIQPAPTDPGIDAALGSIPPEAQFLVPLLKQLTSTMQQGMSENAALTRGLFSGGTVDIDGKPVEFKGIGTMFDAMESRIAEMEQGQRQTSDAIQSLLDDTMERNEENLSRQQEAEQQRQAWMFDQEARKIAIQKQEAHDSMVAQYALEGGFSQDAVLRDIRESDAAFEGRLSELRIEKGIAATELSARYSGLFAQNRQTYVDGTIKNLETLQAGLERLGMQKNTLTQARTESEKKLLTDFWQTQMSLRTDLAKTNLNFASEMTSIILAEKRMKWQEEQSDKRAREQEAAADRRMALQLDRQYAAEDKTARSQRMQTTREARSNLEQLNSYKTLQQTDLRYLNITSLYADWQANKGDQSKRSLLADALQYGMSKFNDSNSAVMIGEYKRYVDSQGGVETMAQKMKSWALGGGNLTDAMIDGMVSATKTGLDSARAQLYKDLYPIRNSIDAFNYSTPGYHIDLGEVVPPDYLPMTDDMSGTAEDLWSRDASPDVSGPFSALDGSVGGSIASSSPIAYLHPEDVAELPRADRHNNPTAMTTDAARSMGLIEGVDYVQGDRFPPDKSGNRPNLYTAKFIGDPIETTIRAIDTGGFRTKGGKNRWTYLDKLGLDDETWAVMNRQQRVEAIKRMNRYEGGTGILFEFIA